MTTSAATESTQQRESTVSGKWVVISMFLFGMLATAVIWVYWHFHLMPFMPLQKAIAAEFENSSPRVTGGQHKSHKDPPMVLRVVMRVPFNPKSSAPEVEQQTGELVDRVGELCREFVPIEDYEILEVHLFHEIKHPSENEIISREFLRHPQTGEKLTRPEDGSAAATDSSLPIN